MKLSFRHLTLSLFLSLLLSFSLTKIYWGETFPYTHDGSNHLARFMNYAAALREGQFPPRFAPYVFSGFGMPVFNYNYPLANIAALPLIVVGVHPERAFAVLTTVFLALGIWATYLSLRQFFRPGASVFGTLLYSSSWYLVVTLVYRGGVGELLAYALTPICFFSLHCWHKYGQRRWWWLSLSSLAALLLAHNVLALMSLALLGLWSLSQITKKRQLLVQWLALWFSAVGLSLWFWLPALAEMKLVALAGDSLRTETAQQLLSWQQLLFSPWRFGFSRVGQLDSLGFGLGPVFLVTIFVMMALGLKRIWLNYHKPQSLLLPVSIGLGVLGGLLLTTTSSEFVWGLPGMSVLQFPWRWLFPTTMLIVLAGAWVYDQVPLRLVKVLLLAVAFLQLTHAWSLKPVDRFHAEKDAYLFFAGTTLTRNENRPQTFWLDSLPDQRREPVIATGSATAIVSEWLGSKRKYQLTVNEDALVTELTVYFPGWEVRADGEKLEQVFLEETGGLVAYRLPARGAAYEISSGFTGRTIPRLIGESVSLGTLILLGVFAVQKRKSNVQS